MNIFPARSDKDSFFFVFFSGGGGGAVAYHVESLKEILVLSKIHRLEGTTLSGKNLVVNFCH